MIQMAEQSTNAQLTVLILATIMATVQAGEIETVATTNGPAPECTFETVAITDGPSSEGRTFEADGCFLRPTMNAQGQVAFGFGSCRLGDPAQDGFAGRSGELRHLGLVRGHFYIDDSGDVFYRDQQTFCRDDLNSTSCFDLNMQVPLRDGSVVLRSNSRDKIAIWQDGLERTLVARGDAVPGLAGLLTFDVFHKTSAAPGGYVFFEADITGPGVTSENDSGLWLAGPQGVALVAHAGSPAPQGGVFASFFGIGACRMLTVNAQGEILFHAELDDGRQVWFFGLPGDLREVNHVGVEQTDDTPFDNHPTFLLEDGRIFHTEGDVILGRGNSQDRRRLIWIGPADHVEPIEMPPAGPAPGTDVLFANQRVEALTVTPDGHIAIKAKLVTGEIGIWAGEPHNLQLVVLDSHAITVADGDTRAIEPDGLYLLDHRSACPDGQYGTRSAMNNAGQVLFIATFKEVFGVRDASEGLFIGTVDVHSTAPQIPPIVIDDPDPETETEPARRSRRQRSRG